MKQQLKEKTLLYRVKTKHDPEAFAELYDLYVEKIYRFVYLKVSHRQLAEDITSDVFLKAWQYLTDVEKGKRIKHFSGFIYRVTRNAIIDTYRKKSRQVETSLDIHIDIRAQESHVEVIHRKHDSAQILTLVKKLKQEYQEVVTLRYVEGMSTKEIAALMDKRPTAVRVMLHRAMKKLQQLADI